MMRKRLLALGLLIALALSGCKSGVAVPSGNDASAGLTTDGITEPVESAGIRGGLDEDGQDEISAPVERVYTVPELNPVTDEHTVTLMIYMVGSDLESKGGAATNDMAEMIASGVDLSRVNLLIYAGGSSKWYSDFSDTENSIYELTEDGFTLVKSFSQKSMGEPASLVEFLNYSYSNYKSDTYNLIFWDHGNGPVLGYGKDKLFDGDSLTLPELKSALSQSPFKGDNKLGFIGFDACLMASAELACTLSDYANLMISSQEVEPNFGWNYAFLDECGVISDASLAEYIVYNFVKYCEAYFAQNENFCADITLSVVDLQYTDELEKSVDALFAKAIDDVTGGYSELAIERYNTKALGRATSGSEYDLVDISDLMSVMSENYPEETTAVQTVLDQMILADGNNTEDCCGMSLYYPYFNKKHYSKSWKESYAQIGLFDSYMKYLGRYEQIWLGTEMSEFFMEPMTPEEYTPGEYTLKLNDDQLEHFLAAGFHILKKYGEGVYCSISYSRDVTLKKDTLTANYDGRTIIVTDDYGNKKTIASTVTDVRGDKYYHTVEYKARNRFFTDSTVVDSSLMTVPAEAQLIVDHATNQVEVGGYYLRDMADESGASGDGDSNNTVNGYNVLDSDAYTDGSSGYEEADDNSDSDDEIQSGKKLPLNTGQFMVFSLSRLEPKYPTRDDNGILLPYEDWTEAGMVFFENISIENGVHFSYEPYYADGSEYFLMFDVIDTQNNHYSSELMPIALAQAPKEEEQEFPVTNYEWEEGKLSPAIKQEGISIQLFEAMSPETLGYKVYGLYATNENDFPVKISFANICINGEYHLKDIPSENVPSHQSAPIIFSKVEPALRLAGYDRLDSIQFSYNIINGFSGKYLIAGDDICISTSEDIKPCVTCVPAMKALAGNQFLADNEEYSIELMDCGHYLGTSNSANNLQARIKFINKTDIRRTFILTGVYVNGFYFDAHSQTVVDGEGTNYDYIPLDDFGSGYLFEEINSVSFDWETLVNVNETESVFNTVINFEQAGNEADIDLDALECIYEDDNFRVYDGGLAYNKTYSEDPHMRVMIIQNISGRDIHYYLHQYDSKSGEYKKVGYSYTPYTLKNSDKVMVSLGGVFSVHSIREKMNFVITEYEIDPEGFAGSNFTEKYTTPDFELKSLEEDTES